MDCVIDADLAQRDVAELFRACGWEVRKWSWHDYEIRLEWAELYLEGEGEILLHGPINDPLSHADELFAPLERAGIRYWGEFHQENRLMQKFEG